MIIEPKVRGFICTTSHPEGCKENVRKQITYIKNLPKCNGPKKVLVIGASTGYGLASRIASTYGCDAATVGVIFDKPASGSVLPQQAGIIPLHLKSLPQRLLLCKTINGDAFSAEIKKQTIDLIKQELGQIDCVVYSLAAPKRTTSDGTTYTSVLKCTGEDFVNTTVDLKTKEIVEVTVPKATEQEIHDTIKVMGGEDWKDWMTALNEAGVLAENTVTVAYSYIGPKLTYPMYHKGTLGAAKAHLLKTAQEMTKEFSNVNAYVSVNKALVTQASAAIPVVPLYIALLYRIMEKKQIHENAIEQIARMYQEKLFVDTPVLDQTGQIRMDDWELREDVQSEIEAFWEKLYAHEITDFSYIDEYWVAFRQLFGFDLPNIDYSKDVNPNVAIPSIKD
ncbi:MAG: enoyl-ACP reductase FabV [Acutalibacteraceae bacterium]